MMEGGFLEADTLKSDRWREKGDQLLFLPPPPRTFLTSIAFRGSIEKRDAVFWDLIAIFSLFSILFSVVLFFSAFSFPLRFFCPCQSVFFLL